MTTEKCSCNCEVEAGRRVAALFQTISDVRSRLGLFFGGLKPGAPPPLGGGKKTQIFNVSDSQNIGLPQVQVFHTNLQVLHPQIFHQNKLGTHKKKEKETAHIKMGVIVFDIQCFN